MLKSLVTASPRSCSDCSVIFNCQTKFGFNCYICGTELCPKCVTEEAVTKIKAVIKHAVSICDDCDEGPELEPGGQQAEELEAEQVSEVAAINSSVEMEASVSQTLSQLLGSPTTSASQNAPTKDTVEKEIVVGKIVLIENTNSSDSTENTVEVVETTETAEDNTPFEVVANKKVVTKKAEDTTKDTTDIKEVKICQFYVQFRCKFGRTGTGCEYLHPKICLSYMKKGLKGCTKDDKCDYVHPKMCSLSLEGKKCGKKRCFLGHIQGTKDLREDSKNSKSDKKSKKASAQDQNEAFFHKGAKKGHVPMDIDSSQDPKVTPKVTSQETPIVTPQVTPQTYPMDSLMKSMQLLTEQMGQIQKSNAEEMRSLWTILQTRIPAQQTYAGIMSQTPKPALPLIPQISQISQPQVINGQHYYLQPMQQ